MYEKTTLATCPICSWNGLIVPKLNLGCPEHGMWWYKPVEEDITNGNTEGDTLGDTVIDINKRRKSRRKERVHRKHVFKHCQKR